MNFAIALLARTPVPLLALLAALPIAACDALNGETDVSGLIASQFVSVPLAPADIEGGLLVSEKAVNPETFLAQVRQQVGTIESVGIGHVDIEAVAASAVGVTAWSDIYVGELLVVLVPASGTPVQVGKVTVPGSGLAKLSATVTTTKEALDRAPDIAAGRFSVRLTAGTPRTSADTFELTARVELEFITF